MPVRCSRQQTSFHQHLNRKVRLPLILDDILIKFDDARSLAALELLAELSKQTQVIFFTHHQHLVGLAESALPRDELFVHTL